MGSESIASIAELASTAATDVGMHGLLASQSCTILCYPLVYVHCGPVVDFFITKQTSLHPFDFVRNLFHLLVIIIIGLLNDISCRDVLIISTISHQYLSCSVLEYPICSYVKISNF